MNDNDVLPTAFGELERAWNSGDGARFGEPFAEDADFVDIRGSRHRGKGAIVGGHQAILDTFYRGSTVHFGVVDKAVLADGCLLGHCGKRPSSPPKAHSPVQAGPRSRR